MSGALFDRDVDQVPPLGPRAVVVAYVLVPEQLTQDEPRVSASLADPAVRRHSLVRGDALSLIERSQLVGSLERPVVADRLRPRNRGRGRNMSCTLRAFLLVAGGSDHVARVLLRAAHVDECILARTDRPAHPIAVGADRLVAGARRVGWGGGVPRIA